MASVSPKDLGVTGDGKKAGSAPVTSQEPGRAGVDLGTCTSPWHELVLSHPWSRLSSGGEDAETECGTQWGGYEGVPEAASCAGEGGSPAVMGADRELELKLPVQFPCMGLRWPRLYTSVSISHETGLRGRL